MNGKRVNGNEYSYEGRRTNPRSQGSAPGSRGGQPRRASSGRSAQGGARASAPRSGGARSTGTRAGSSRSAQPSRGASSRTGGARQAPPRSGGARSAGTRTGAARGGQPSRRPPSRSGTSRSAHPSRGVPPRTGGSRGSQTSRTREQYSRTREQSSRTREQAYQSGAASRARSQSRPASRRTRPRAGSAGRGGIRATGAGIAAKASGLLAGLGLGKSAGRRRAGGQKISPALRVMLIIVGILLVIFVGVFAFSQFELGKIGRLHAIDFIGENFDQNDNGPDTIDAVEWGKAGLATKVDGVVNVLLVGQDSRNEERARSDSMIIMSVNKNTNQVTMISLMRDLYVQIPGYSNNKLNSAYAFGGFKLLDDTIAQNFGVNIDYNVEVNFKGFKDIVDTLGGIDIDLNQEEAEYMNSAEFRHDMGKAGKKVEQTFKEGTNHMDGAAALCYARIRHVGNSDWERTDRQRKVIQLIYSQIRTESWPKLLKIYSSVAKDLTTDMSNLQIISVAFSAYSMGLQDINSYRVPADNTFTNERINRMDVMIPKDWDKTRALLQSYLYDEDGGAAAEEEAQAPYKKSA